MRDEPKQTKKKRKKEVASPELRRATLLRLFAMMRPWRLWLLAGNTFTILTSALGVFSLVAVLPVLQIVFQVKTDFPMDGRDYKAAKAAHAVEKASKQADDGVETAAMVSVEAAAPEKPIRFLSHPSKYMSRKRKAVEAWMESRGRDHPVETISWVVLIFGFATLLGALFDYGSRYCILHVETEFLRSLMTRIYAHCLRQDLAFFNQHSAGMLMTHAYNDVNRIQTLLELTYVSRVQQPVTLLFLSGLLISINPTLALVTFALVPFLLLPAMGIVYGVRRLSRKEATEDFGLMELLRERLSGVFLIKTHHAEEHEIGRFESYAKTIFRRRRKRGLLTELNDPVMDVLTAVGIILVIYAGIEVVLNRHWIAGETYLFFLIVLSRFYKPIKELTRTYAMIQRPLMSAAAIFKILDEPARIVDAPNARAFPNPWSEIRLENVSFAYGSNSPDVLKGLNLALRAGESTALVGHNGSGKSTLALLLTRFYDPRAGRILVDGADLRDIALDDLRSKIAIIGQHSILFNLTVAENIAYGAPRDKIDMERVRRAAERAGADRFIERLPGQYAAAVGHGRGRLSGGQRQLIAMARVFYRDSGIVIYDEPTVHLDAGAEAAVMDVIASMMETRTVILITHNEEHARLAKRIVRLDHGVLVPSAEVFQDAAMDSNGL